MSLIWDKSNGHIDTIKIPKLFEENKTVGANEASEVAHHAILCKNDFENICKIYVTYQDNIFFKNSSFQVNQETL